MLESMAVSLFCVVYLLCDFPPSIILGTVKEEILEDIKGWCALTCFLLMWCIRCGRAKCIVIIIHCFIQNISWIIGPSTVNVFFFSQ